MLSTENWKERYQLVAIAFYIGFTEGCLFLICTRFEKGIEIIRNDCDDHN